MQCTTSSLGSVQNTKEIHDISITLELVRYLTLPNPDGCLASPTLALFPLLLCLPHFPYFPELEVLISRACTHRRPIRTQCRTDNPRIMRWHLPDFLQRRISPQRKGIIRIPVCPENFFRMWGKNEGCDLSGSRQRSSSGAGGSGPEVNVFVGSSATSSKER